jgi:hypothetical protein
MDHAPGPIIAIVPPRLAKTSGIHGLPICVMAIPHSIAAIKPPAIGVQRPTRRSIPAAPPTMCGIIDGENDVPMTSMTATRTSKPAVTMRWSRRPNPGQLLGKVENSLRKSSSVLLLLRTSFDLCCALVVQHLDSIKAPVERFQQGCDVQRLQEEDRPCSSRRRSDWASLGSRVRRFIAEGKPSLSLFIGIVPQYVG